MRYQNCFHSLIYLQLIVSYIKLVKEIFHISTLLLQAQIYKMDVQTGLVYVAVVVISAAVIVLVSMFGIKEKSYEEAIAEQRKLPDDLLLSMYSSMMI